MTVYKYLQLQRGGYIKPRDLIYPPCLIYLKDTLLVGGGVAA